MVKQKYIWEIKKYTEPLAVEVGNDLMIGL